MTRNVPTIFIFSYERPLYLWATLDSLYRTTRSDMRFVLIDSSSLDPLVTRVIEGFSRRGMLSEVIKLDRNDKDGVVPIIAERLMDIGEVFFCVDGDVVIRPEKTCWARRMLAVMQGNPRMAMLGSLIDKSDFIGPDLLEQRLGRKLTVEEQEQIKLHSPERTMPDIVPDDVQSPFNPPGRLLALRTKAILAHIDDPKKLRDSSMHRIFKENGWDTGIYGGVVHRHLSLCNYFDYPDYSMALRDRYFSRPL